MGTKEKLLTFDEISKVVLIVPEGSRGPLDDYIVPMTDYEILQDINKLMGKSAKCTSLNVIIQWEILYKRNLSEDGYGLN